MADPLSVASGVVGIVSLGIQVIGGLLKYYDEYREQDETVRRISDRLNTLVGSLQLLDKTIQLRQFRAEEADIVAAINSSILNSEECILVLRKKREKIHKSMTEGLKGSIMIAGSRITYPFRKGTLEKLDENIRAIQGNLALALDVLQLRDNQQLRSDATTIRQLTELMFASQISSDIHQWLKAPDATINHNSNCAKRHPGSGSWFVEGSQFNTWLDQPNSFLWVTGFAGSGKSVLCSTAILHTFRRKSANSGIAVACFYFTFTDSDKQDASGMLRALILQLGSQSDTGILELSKFYTAYKAGIPSDTVLLGCLHQIIKKFNQVYVLLDALDEVPRGRSRRDMLKAVAEMQAWAFSGLHIMVTSRDEVDIHDHLPIDRLFMVISEGTGVDQDIENFIESQLTTDVQLLKWKRFHEKIRRALTAKAHGVFRWVECQLEAIKQCPRSSGQLEECLQSLPDDLDETYERILCGIKGQSTRAARQMLMALSYARRPLTVSELIDVIAVELESSPSLNRDLRYEDADSLLELCPGLIQIYVPHRETYQSLIWWPLNTIHEAAPSMVRIAHFSVQEYLESSRIKQQDARYFALQESDGHAEMTKICLSYLFEPELVTLDSTAQDVEGLPFLDDLPFVDYAAQYWPGHLFHSDSRNNDIQGLISRLFTSDRPTFHNWVRVYDHHAHWRARQAVAANEIKSPIFYASILDLHSVLVDLLAANAKMGDKREDCGDALREASHLGLQETVMTLIEWGADINAQGHRGSALYAASGEAHEHIVSMLLDRGADIDATGAYGSALHAAVRAGHEQMVNLLLDRGADVNIQGERWPPSALAIAAHCGFEQMVTTLLDRGADVNAGGGYHGTALYEAARYNHEQTVSILLDRGADDSIQGGFYGYALVIAAHQGHERIVRMLLDRGADVNAQGGEYGTALKAASKKDHKRIVQILLDHGATYDEDNFRPLGDTDQKLHSAV